MTAVFTVQNQGVAYPTSRFLAPVLLFPFQDEYEAPMMPQGFVFQFHLLSTWGDLYYTGLNGIELYDAAGHKIPLTEKSAAILVHLIG